MPEETVAEKCPGVVAGHDYEMISASCSKIQDETPIFKRLIVGGGRAVIINQSFLLRHSSSNFYNITIKEISCPFSFGVIRFKKATIMQSDAILLPNIVMD